MLRVILASQTYHTSDPVPGPLLEDMFIRDFISSMYLRMTMLILKCNDPLHLILNPPIQYRCNKGDVLLLGVGDSLLGEGIISSMPRSFLLLTFSGNSHLETPGIALADVGTII